jgi:hypothetical protein
MTTTDKTPAPTTEEPELIDIPLDQVTGGCTTCGDPKHASIPSGPRYTGTVYDAFFNRRG